MTMQELLAPGRFVDSNTPSIEAFAHRVTAELRDETDRIVRLYRAVRDSIVYDPYVDVFDQQNYRASSVLAAGRGFCIGKSAVLAATARVIGVPARVGYADVRNHLTSRRLRERTKSDIFIWHFLCRSLHRREMGQSDPGIRSGALRTGRIETTRVRWPARFTVSSL